jgi:hypothetical protein
VGGTTLLNAQGNFAGTISPGSTGGRGEAIGSLTATSVGSGIGPAAVNSASSGNVFAEGQVVATNQFGIAGGLGSGAATAASKTTGIGAISGTVKVTGNFNNEGAAAFATPPNVLGVNRNTFVGATGNRFVPPT